MLFQPDAEQAARLDAVRRFLDEKVLPHEAAARRDFQDAQPALDALREEVKALGLWAPHMPPDLGGVGLGFLEHAQLSEILGRSPIGHYVFGCPAPDAGNMELLHQFGTDAQKAQFLAPLVRGEIRSCFSMTEPDRAGANPIFMDTTAVADGDEYVITGKKWFTTGGHLADFAIIMAVTDPDAAPHGRASMFIVPADTPGYTHVRRISVMGEEGYGWSSHSEMRYEGCRVPKENLVGPLGGGFMLAQARLGPGRIHHCMRWLGICERALDLMCEHAKNRELSPGTPLSSKQAIRMWVAESRAEIDAARLYVYDTARRIDEHGARGAKSEISCIKFFVAGVLGRVLDRAIQTHGALGMTDDTPLAWFYRHERAARIYDGPDEVHKESVARRLLRAD